MTERIDMLRSQSVNAEPSLTIERALIETEFYRKNEGKYSIPVLRAKNFYNLCAKKRIYIGDNELIVGERGPKPKGREWRRYYRLVHNFAKAYPYALLAEEKLREADSTITADELRRGKRNRYINILQKELFETFEKPLRNLTVSQGKLLLRLIDRQTGITPYEIIHNYKGRAAAGFWQGIAKLFGSDMKLPYDPNGEDKETEELVIIYQKGEFNNLYRSIFGKNPPEPVIRSRLDITQK